MSDLVENVERYLYPVPTLPLQTRAVPMQVLALGLSRSGTDSLRAALTILGYTHTYHGFDCAENEPPAFEAWTRLARRKYDGGMPVTTADFDRILGHCRAITDQPGAFFAAELIAAYPDAKIILNWRDEEAWYKSIMDTLVVHLSGFKFWCLPWFHPRLYWRRRYFKELQDRFFHASVKKNGKWVYREHCAKIRGLVKDPKRILEWRVQEGWGPLCQSVLSDIPKLIFVVTNDSFLGEDIPGHHFPSGNTSPELLARLQDYYAEYERRALWNLTGVILFVLVAGLAIGWPAAQCLLALLDCP